MIIIIILLLVSCGGRDSSGSDSQNRRLFSLTEDQSSRFGPVPTRDPDEIMAELNRKVEEGTMIISMNLNPVFENGTAEGNLGIYNDSENRFGQVVEIFLNSDNRLLYRSGLISPGNHVANGRLLADLEPGDYACTAFFTSVDGDTAEAVGKAGAEIIISVLG